MKYFLDVAHTEHMTKSAERLRIAQPALSRQIARLERELGVQLFERVGRGLRLTEAGRVLQAELGGVCRDLERVREDVARAGRAERCEVRVQVGAASRLVADALAQWMGRGDRPAISLTQSSREPDEDADVVVDSQAPASGCEGRSFSERIMLAVPAGWDRADAPVRLADLTGEGFISLAASSGFCRFTQELCREAGFRPRVSLESDNPSVVRQMIGLGLGVGFWPEFSWGAVDGGEVALLPLDVSRRREVHVWLTPRSQAKPEARAFYEHLCASFAGCFGV